MYGRDDIILALWMSRIYGKHLRDIELNPLRAGLVAESESRLAVIRQRAHGPAGER